MAPTGSAPICGVPMQRPRRQGIGRLRSRLGSAAVRSCCPSASWQSLAEDGDEDAAAAAAARGCAWDD